MLTRRVMMAGGALAVGAAWSSRWWTPDAGADESAAAPGPFDVTYTETEWRKRLTPDQFAVLRQSGTERPFTSPLNDEHRRGTFACAGCEREAFSSTTKFDSHTGWPSFWAPIGVASGNRTTGATAWCAALSTAAVAVGISAMCLTMARSRRACATA